jgi:hypothetical protein
MTENSKESPQLSRFKEAARQLGTDDDPERFAEKVRKLAKAKPVPADKKPVKRAEGG